MRQTERLLQREVMARLRFAPVRAIIVPSPNGVFMPAKTVAERALVRQIMYRLKVDGQLLPGAPDLLVLWSHGCGGIELKRPPESTLLEKQPPGRLSEAQVAFKVRCDELGVNYAVCQSWDEVRETLKAWGRLPATYQDADRRIGRAA